MTKYELLIFDLDDTLINNEENVRYAFRKMTELLGYPYSDELFNRWQAFDKQFWLDFYNNKLEVPYKKMTKDLSHLSKAFVTNSFLLPIYQWKNH